MNSKRKAKLFRGVLAAAMALILAASALVTAFADTSSVSIERILFNNPGFIRGMDISSVVSLERAGVKFYDESGAEEDIFKILSDKGVNYIRVRVWNRPFDSEGNGYGGGNCDITTAAEIGRRAAEYGMRLLVDFHYSDFWADPGKQKAPKDWENLSLDDKCEALYEYTLNSLSYISQEGADIGMVQIGNETNSGIAGEYVFSKMPRLFSAGADAVRAFDKNILIAVHFTGVDDTQTIKWRADYLSQYNVNYDVFGVSYYPYWHGSLSNLTEVLNYVAATYGKYTMVAETSYANTLDDTDGHGNTVSQWSNNTGDDMLWDFTAQGQAQELHDVMQAVNSVSSGKGLGVFYWEGAWITVGDVTGLQGSAYTRQVNKNKNLWESYGAGWASSYGGDYDSDAGLYYGGSAVDNQAFFSPSGEVLPSLDVYRLVCTDNGEIVLGDVSKDGSIDVNDVTLIQKYIAKLIKPDNISIESADANRDRIMDIVDATTVQKKIAGIIDRF